MLTIAQRGIQVFPFYVLTANVLDAFRLECLSTVSPSNLIISQWVLRSIIEFL